MRYNGNLYGNPKEVKLAKTCDHDHSKMVMSSMTFGHQVNVTAKV